MSSSFAAALRVRGAPAQSPGALALVTALQYVENLTDGRPRRWSPGPSTGSTHWVWS
jgi:hypothetical protein